jgi:hypothetical protein
MSVILDALKKLDREKSIRQHATANIAVEILTPDLPRLGNRFSRYFAPVFLTAIGAAVITYFTMGYFQKKSSLPAPMPSSAPSQGVMPAPMEHNLPLKASVPVDPPAIGQPITPAPLSRESVHETRKDLSQGAPQTEVPPQTKVTGENKVLGGGKPITAPLDEKKASQTATPEKKEVVPESTPRKIPQTAVSDSGINPLSLKVSAIVWYEEPSMRFAMINGLKATEGSVIEGVKVVEIKPTSVRLFHNEKYFELFMDR